MERKSNGKVARARRLAADVGRLTDAERAALAERLPTVVNPDGHALSVRNTIVLSMQSQRTDLTMVAGFKQWIRAARVVKKGEHSIGMIMVPMTLKRKDAAGEPLEDGGTDLRFRYVPVFDVSQTEELAAAERGAA